MFHHMSQRDTIFTKTDTPTANPIARAAVIATSTPDLTRDYLTTQSDRT